MEVVGGRWWWRTVMTDVNGVVVFLRERGGRERNRKSVCVCVKKRR